MARVTVEDCLQKVPNRFALVHLGAQRVHQLNEGAPPMVEARNKEIVVALREIAAGHIFPVSQEEAEREKAEAQARERIRLNLAQAALEASKRPAPVQTAPLVEDDADEDSDEDEFEASEEDVVEDLI